MRRWRPLAVALAAGLAALHGCHATAAPPGEAPRVGEGDSRQGYESSAYVTRSRQVSGDAGASADLAALGRRPPLGLPPLAEPPSRASIELGRRLFFDRRLSANGTLSCGMCHVPEQAFTQNELATPVGIEGAFVRRNAPSLYNVAYQRTLFHDGRETRLEDQIWSPLLAPNEMGNADRAAVLARIASSDEYRPAFLAAFGSEPDAESLGRALAAYQRVLLAGDSAFDRWYFGGEQAA